MNGDYGHLLGAGIAGAAAAARAPVPRRGQNQDFDRYFDEYMGDEVPEGDIDEMRKAAWATWRTEAPSAASRPGGTNNEDDDLARALALSREELSRPSSTQPSLHDDDDQDLLRAIAMSEMEARAPKRQKRDETPEEERKMLEEAMAASLAASQATASASRSNGLKREESDELIESANRDFQAERAADRARQQKARLAKLEEEGQSRSASSTSFVKLEGKPLAKAAAANSMPVKLEKEASTQSSAPSSSTIVPRPSPPPPARVPGTVNSLLSDRAKMEEERIARQLARSGGQPAPAPVSVTTSAPTSAPAAAPAPFRASVPNSAFYANGSTSTSTANGRSGPSTSRAAIQHPYQARSTFPRDAAGEYYPDGELRHTALTIGEPTSEPTFSAAEIIGNRSQIALLILNSYVIDDNWLSTILPDPLSVPQIIIRPHPKAEPTWNGKVQAQPSGEVWCYPKMTGDFGSQHMKYIWIFYKTGRLRVIISTANFVSYDWELIENTVFVQDFLPLPSPQPIRTSHKQHDFPLQFTHLFKHLKVHKALDYLIKNHEKGPRIPLSASAEFGDMAKYNWSPVTVRLVMSIPGTYEGWEEMEKFGMCRVGQVIKEEEWRPAKGEKAVVEYQGSSLGQYGIDWFSHFHQLCSGKSPRELANQPKAKAWAPIKVIFPSLATVDASVMGRNGGSTMFVGKAWNSVMKAHFHDSNSKRGGVLLHAKLLVTTFEPQEQALGFASSNPTNGKRKAEEMEEDSKGVGGWVYVGSHNFSSAAWGTVNVKKSPPTLHVRNYELGILFPLPRAGANKMADLIVPYKRPARLYGANDVPWDQNLHAEQ